MEDDIVVKDHSKPFSSIIQGKADRNEKIFCSLCANAGVESVIRDDICGFCGDVGVKIGLSKDDELFVVNSVGGGAADTPESNRSNFFGTFGGLPSEKKRAAPNQQHSLQDALKETEI